MTTIGVPQGTVAGRGTMLREALLVGGILSSILYVAMNVVAAARWSEYSSLSQTVSELSAIGAPTRPLWMMMAIPYTLLVTAFGWSVWRSGEDDTPLRVSGALIFVYGALGVLWPFAPMHLRADLAAGGGSLTDTVHILLGIVTVCLMLAAIGFGSVALGPRFRRYSLITLVVVFVSGFLTGIDAPAIPADRATPWIGLWERINIAAFLLWVIVLAVALLRTPATTPHRAVSNR